MKLRFRHPWDWEPFGKWQFGMCSLLAWWCSLLLSLDSPDRSREMRYFGLVLAIFQLAVLAFWRRPKVK
jgi:hypothetical protein